MTRKEFLASFDAILELPSGTLSGSEKLENLENWNSLAMIEVIALADTNDGVKLSARQMGACDTVSDLLKLANVER